MANAFAEAEETTRGGVPRVVPRTVPALSEDAHEALGQIMRETVRQGRQLDAFGTTLTDALAEMRKERPALAHTVGQRAATHTSNRMAALLGALFVLYSEAAPVLHELWRSLHR